MKKTYMIPSQKVAEIELEALIAESPQGFEGLHEKSGFSEDGYEGGYTKQQKTLWDEAW